MNKLSIYKTIKIGVVGRALLGVTKGAFAPRSSKNLVLGTKQQGRS